MLRMCEDACDRLGLCCGGAVFAFLTLDGDFSDLGEGMNSYGRERVCVFVGSALLVLSCCFLLVQMRWCWEIIKANLEMDTTLGENREELNLLGAWVAVLCGRKQRGHIWMPPPDAAPAMKSAAALLASSGGKNELEEHGNAAACRNCGSETNACPRCSACGAACCGRHPNTPLLQ